MSQIVRRYFQAFGDGDAEAMLATLSENVEHHVNQGETRHGKAAFATFLAHMNRCYREDLTDLVIFTNEDGTRIAAEFVVSGNYLATDAGLPEARGQTYRLPAGSFFALEDGLITRVTTYYNLQDWLTQVRR